MHRNRALSDRPSSHPPPPPPLALCALPYVGHQWQHRRCERRHFVSMWLWIMSLQPGALTFCCRLAMSVGCFALNGYATHRITKTYNCSFFLRSSSSLCSFSRSSFSSLTADGLGLVGRALLRLLLGASPPELSLVLLGEMRDPAWGAIASLLSSSTIPSDSSSLDDGSNILL